MTSIATKPNGTNIVHYAIKPLDLVVIDGIEHTWVSTDQNGHVLSLRSDPVRHVSFDHHHYYNLVTSDRAVRQPDYFSEGAARARNIVKWAPISTLPKDKALRTLMLGDALDIFIRMREACRRGEREDGRKVNTGDKSLSWVLDEISAELVKLDKAQVKQGGSPMGTIHLPGPRDFRRKLRKYIEAGYDNRVLDDRTGGTSTRNRVVNLLEYSIRREHQLRYASRNRPTMSSVWIDYLAGMKTLNDGRATEGLRPIKPVSRKTFVKGIKNLDLFHVALGREEEAAAHKLMNINARGLDVERPLERVEMDEWMVDLKVLLVSLNLWERMAEEERLAVTRGRLWATVVIDAATRVILAMKVFSKAPSAELAITTLEMAMMDKTLISEVVGTGSPWIYHGRITDAYTDRGSAFLSQECRMVMLDAGVSHIFPVAGKPQLRPYVERVFKTCSQRFLQWFSGRTFSDYLTKGEYNSDAHASLCIDEFNKVFLRALIDIYHHTPHEGLAGETPHNAWMRLSRKYGVEQPFTSIERRHIFGLHCTAVIGDNGLRSLGLHYQSPRLQKYRKRVGNAKARFRLDRFNLSGISVWDGAEWFDVPTRLHFPENVSIWEWVEACRKLRKVHAKNAEIGLSIVLNAVNALRETGEAAMHRAELGTPAVNAEYVKHQEEKLFRGLKILDDVQEPTRLLDLTVARNLPSLPADDFEPDTNPEPRYRDRLAHEGGMLLQTGDAHIDSRIAGDLGEIED